MGEGKNQGPGETLGIPRRTLQAQPQRVKANERFNFCAPFAGDPLRPGFISAAVLSWKPLWP